MTLEPGAHLGPYEILALLGAGGMGEVYRAKDSRLGREVAVKVLPAEVANDSERLRRFEHEARSASALNHPNILTVFDVGRDGQTSYLVTELLLGESLRARLERGSPGARRAVELALQIARGLAVAHAKGIVHRDLKPENLYLTADGGLKILDFGLAKLLLPDAETVSGFHAASTRAELTREGTVVGTVGYMAPEQVRGEDVDARADLFSFGCVLYELLTGERAFARATPVDTLSAILRDEPPPLASPERSDVPPALARIVSHCLEKRPDDRFQSARDLGFALEALAAPTSGATASHAPRPAARLRRPAIALALIALLVAALPAAYWLGRQRASSGAPDTVRLELSPPEGYWFNANSDETVSIAISPDGRTLAFVAVNDRGWLAYSRRIGEAEARPLAGTEGASSLTWSPDGTALAFHAGGKLKRIDLAGGSPVPVCDLAPAIGHALSWGAGGDLLFAPVGGEAIYRVSAAGGVPRRVVEADAARQIHRVAWPVFLPDGRGFLYLERSGEGRSALMLVDGDAPPREVAPLASRVEFVAPDWLLFVREGALYAQRFDRAAASLVGNAVAVAPYTRYFFTTGWAGFAASANGAIVYFAGQNVRRLTWFDRQGTVVGKVGEDGDYLGLALAPDGKSVLVDRAQPELGTYDLWRIDLERGVETRVTTDSDTQMNGIWLPDGRSVVYSTVRTRAPALARRDLASGAEELLLPREPMQLPSDVSPDGRLLAFRERGEDGGFRAWTLELEGERRARELLPPETRASHVRFSPDGRFVAYLAATTGSDELYVAPLDRPTDAVRVSASGASLFRWNRSRRELVYLDDERRLVAASVRTTPALAVGAPAMLFPLPEASHWADFDIAPDGDRLLAVVVERGASAVPASVVLGWRPVQTR